MASDFIDWFLFMLIINMIIDYVRFQRGKLTADNYSILSICIGIVVSLVWAIIGALLVGSVATGVGIWFAYILSDIMGRWFYLDKLIEQSDDQHKQ